MLTGDLSVIPAVIKVLETAVKETYSDAKDVMVIMNLVNPGILAVRCRWVWNDKVYTFDRAMSVKRQDSDEIRLNFEVLIRLIRKGVHE